MCVTKCEIVQKVNFLTMSLTGQPPRQDSENLTMSTSTDLLNSNSLSVYSRGPASFIQIDKLGVYKKTNETMNGKPTWRNNQTGHSIFYHGEILNVKTKLNILYLENGHWLIGDKYQNVGGFKSVRTDLDDVPTKGWLYNDRTKWNYGDPSIKVYGDKKGK